MTSANLANLAKVGQLKAEPASPSEFDGLVRSGRARLIGTDSCINCAESLVSLMVNRG